MISVCPILKYFQISKCSVVVGRSIFVVGIRKHSQKCFILCETIILSYTNQEITKLKHISIG